MSTHFYFVPASVSCFDANGPEGPTGPESPSSPAGPSGPSAPAFTDEQQKYINDLVKREASKEGNKKAGEYRTSLEKIEKDYKEMLSNSTSLSVKERQVLEENLTTIQGQLRTKEETAAREKKELEDKLSGKIKEVEARAETWESKYKGEKITRSLLDAVAADAYRSEQVVTLLKPMTKLVDEVDASGKPTGGHRVVLDFPDVDSTTGEDTVSVFTPAEAVKRMKELPEIYGNLFKSNVVSGIGGSSSAGLPTGANGQTDLKKLARNPAQLQKAIKDNPEQFGLRRK